MRKHFLVLVLTGLMVGCGMTARSQSAEAADAAGGSHDVVIYGGTSAAVTAAVQARLMGRSVVIVSPDKHLGGLSAGGLGWTDSGNKTVIGGLSRDFYRRVKAHYDQDSAWRQQKPEQYSRYRKAEDAMWVFEPHVAEKVFEDYIREFKIPVYKDRWLDRAKGVVKKDGRIVSITTLSGETYAGRIFIDATYEGDLMAAAGVQYAVGREANSVYGETLNGIQARHARSHQFTNRVSPFVVADDPSSGLLPRVHDDGPGEDGAGDHRIQAYNYRVCLTNDDSNRVPFPKPEGYDALQYELLLRDLQAGSRHIFGKFDPAPNHKTDTNNHGSFSTDNIGMNYDYPEASYERRAEILKEHQTYQKGYFWFLCNDPRVPEDVRKRMSAWGLPKDEFQATGGWPHQIYVREARRMVGVFVMSGFALSARCGAHARFHRYGFLDNMDSHNTQRYVARDADGKAYVQNEGDIQVNPGGPYPIAYGSIVPKKDQCSNLLVPVAVSSSHIAYGSIRMEPVFMVLGQSAATAASLALESDLAVQDVPYASLSKRLLADGQVLEFARPVSSAAAGQSLDLKKLKGLVVDDMKARPTGDWKDSHVNGPFVGAGYRHDDNAAKGQKQLRFEVKLPKPGRYEVRLAYTANANRATNVPVAITHHGGEAVIHVNQRLTPKLDGAFISLGLFTFADSTAVIVVSNAQTDGYVVVDGLQVIAAD